MTVVISFPGHCLRQQHDLGRRLQEEKTTKEIMITKSVLCLYRTTSRSSFLSFLLFWGTSLGTTTQKLSARIYNNANLCLFILHNLPFSKLSKKIEKKVWSSLRSWRLYSSKDVNQSTKLVDVKISIWIHPLSRQPFWRQLVTRNRSLIKTSSSLLDKEHIWLVLNSNYYFDVN